MNALTTSSSFVANLVPRDEMLMGNICISSKFKGVENMNLRESVSDIEEDVEISVVDTNYRGYTKSKSHTKLWTNPSCPRTCTLLKPTVSQLAKENHPLQAGYSRSNMSVEKWIKAQLAFLGLRIMLRKGKSLRVVLRMVVDAEQLQQISFVHKVPKRDGVTDHTKTRITIPREPDFETAQRALKTRPVHMNASRPEVCESSHGFKANPLNKKILTSKGTFGVF